MGFLGLQFSTPPGPTLDLRVQDDRRIFHPGQSVPVIVSFVVSAPTTLASIRVTVKGKEVAQGRRQQGKTPMPFNWTCVFYEDTHELAVASGPAGGELFGPGQHTRQVAIRLPEGIPMAFILTDYRAGPMHNVSVYRYYDLKVRLLPHSTQAPFRKTKSSLPLVLRPDPTKLPPVVALRPVHVQTRGPIALLGCFRRGLCTLTVRGSSRDFDDEAGILGLNIHVDNRGTQPVTSVRVRLLEDFQLCPPGRDGGWIQTHTLVQNTYVKTIAPMSTGRLGVDFPIGASLEELRGKGRAVFPNISGYYARTGFRLEVTCVYTWCADVEIEFPIALHGRTHPRVMAVPNVPVHVPASEACTETDDDPPTATTPATSDRPAAMAAVVVAAMAAAAASAANPSARVAPMSDPPISPLPPSPPPPAATVIKDATEGEMAATTTDGGNDAAAAVREGDSPVGGTWGDERDQLEPTETVEVKPMAAPAAPADVADLATTTAATSQEIPVTAEDGHSGPGQNEHQQQSSQES